jgi:hypothetical protein
MDGHAVRKRGSELRTYESTHLHPRDRFNARSIGDEVNIFRGLDKNPIFLAIIFFTVIVQYAIIQVGTWPFV